MVVTLCIAVGAGCLFRALPTQSYPLSHLIEDLQECRPRLSLLVVCLHNLDHLPPACGLSACGVHRLCATVGNDCAVRLQSEEI